jgi:hypothetical protein
MPEKSIGEFLTHLPHSATAGKKPLSLNHTKGCFRLFRVKWVMDTDLQCSMGLS